MIKKVLSLAICVVMVLAMATVAVSAAQVEIANGAADAQAEVAANNETEAGTGASQVINFDPSGTGWNNYSKIFAHVYSVDGEGTWPSWQSKAEACKKNDDGTWTYDLSKCGNSITEQGAYYAVVFSNENGMETYNLLFGAACIGDTAYCDGTTCENPVDSTKNSLLCFWKGQDKSKFGPRLQVTSIGNIVGSCVPSNKTPYSIMVEFLKDSLESARQYSGKDDQAIVDDAAKALGLYKEDVTKAIAEVGVSVDWDASKSSLPEGTNPEASKSGDEGGGGDNGGNNGGNNGGTNGGGSGSSKSGSGSGSTTGQDTTLLFVMLGVLVAAAGVIFFVRKREKA